MRKDFDKLSTPNSFETGKVYSKKLNGFTMFTILFSLFMLIIGVTAGLTYAGFQSTATSNGTLTFAVNGHQGTMNLSNTKVSSYNSQDLTLTFTLASDTNYTTPTISGITMGDATLTKDGNNFKSSSIIVATYSAPTLTINRANVSGNLVITGSSTAQTYTITYNSNGGSGTMIASTPNYGSTTTLPANTFTRTGYTFAGWSTTSSGNIEFCDSARIKDLGNITLYAKWTANEITFDNQNKSLTYSTTSQTTTITGASNGTGTYTYSITAGNDDSYFSISSTTITAGADTPVGVYNLAITATDSGSGKTRTSIISITINYITLGTPVVSISTAGVVTWGAITGASSYDISIDGTTWTTGVSSGVNYFDSIVAGAGSRTVRVRANPSANYDASKVGTASITVYGITVAGTNGTVRVSRTSTAGSATTLNFISGTTAYIFATAGTGYHFVNWTKNAGNAPASTTTANTSLTVNATATHTANFAINTYTITISARSEKVNGTFETATTGGTVSGGGTYNHGTNIKNQLGNSPATGFNFGGYFTDQACTSALGASETLTGNITVYAKFSRNTYTVTLTNGTGISATSGAGTYRYGATVTLGATVSSGYTWSRWTQTSGGAQVSTTQAYSAVITSNWAYTANATANSKSVRITLSSNWDDPCLYYEVTTGSYKMDGNQIEALTSVADGATSGNITINSGQYLYVYAYNLDLYEDDGESVWMETHYNCTGVNVAGFEYVTESNCGEWYNNYRIYRLSYSNAINSQTYTFNFYCWVDSGNF